MLLSDIVAQERCLVTRVWGFTPETWGALGFPKRGTAEKWAVGSQNLFVVCFVSHNSADHIDPNDQGRVLGLYELEPNLVELEDPKYLDQFHLRDAQSRRDNGDFRWPFGLPAVRAWRFVPAGPLTRETLPEARAHGYDVSTDMIPIEKADFARIDRFRLEPVPVFGQEFDNSILKDPNATPDHIYVFYCDKQDQLSRIPGYRAGEVLVKPGCASDVKRRLSDFNDHPIAHIMQIQLGKLFERYVGTARAFEEEASLLEYAASIGRPASVRESEFFFIKRNELISLAAKGGMARHVQ